MRCCHHALNTTCICTAYWRDWSLSTYMSTHVQCNLKALCAQCTSYIHTGYWSPQFTGKTHIWSYAFSIMFSMMLIAKVCRDYTKVKFTLILASESRITIFMPYSCFPVCWLYFMWCPLLPVCLYTCMNINPQNSTLHDTAEFLCRVGVESGSLYISCPILLHFQERLCRWWAFG